jgi:ribonuclease BN (tRNA processing enzyme)
MADVHVTPEEAGAFGRAAEARTLVLTHLPSGADDASVAERAADAYGQPVTVARDFMAFAV